MSEWICLFTSLLNSQGFMIDGPGTGQWDEGWKAHRLEYTRFSNSGPRGLRSSVYCSTKRTSRPQNDLVYYKVGGNPYTSAPDSCISLHFAFWPFYRAWGMRAFYTFPLGCMLTFAKLFWNVVKFNFTKFPKSETLFCVDYHMEHVKKFL